jgi:hypothetical protein
MFSFALGFFTLKVIFALRKVPADEREDLVRLILAPETLLLRKDKMDADNIIDALSKVPADEREDLVRLITAPETRLVREDLENAENVIESLTQIPADERELLVLFMTDPKNRLIDDEKKNVKKVIEAFSEFRYLEIKIRKTEKELKRIKRKIKANPFCKILTNLG